MDDRAMVHKLGLPPPSDEEVQMSPEITRSQNSSNRIQTQNTNSGLTLNSNAGLPNLQPSSNPKSLPQTITLMPAVAIIIGTIIGTGIFKSPHTIVKEVNSVGMTLVVWVLCGILSQFAALCYLELGLMLKKSGGEYTYLQHTFGNRISYVLAVLYSLVTRPVSSALVAITFADYITADYFTDSGHWVTVAFALFLIWVTTLVNCYSTTAALKLQQVYLYAKLGLVSILILSGFVQLSKGYTSNFKNPFQNTTASPGSLAVAFYGGLWPYEGWNSLNFLSEEVVNPAVTMKTSIFISCPVIMVIYLLVNITYFTSLSPAEIISSEAVAIDYGMKALGPLVIIIPYLVCVSAAGTYNSGSMVTSRFMYVAARDGNLPKWACLISARRKTPVASLLLSAVLTSLIVLPKNANFDTLLEIFGFTQWFFYATTFLALLYLRKREPTASRPFKVPIFIAIFACIFSYVIVLVPLVFNPKWEYLYVIGLIVLSFGMYYVLIEKGLRIVTKVNSKFSDFIALRLNLIKPEGEFCDTENREMGAQSTYTRFD